MKGPLPTQVSGLETSTVQAATLDTPVEVTPATDPQLAQLALKDLRRRAEADRRDAARVELERDQQARHRAEESLVALTRQQRELRESLRQAGITLPVQDWGALDGGSGHRNLGAQVAGHWLTLERTEVRRVGVEGETGLVRGAADLLCAPLDVPVMAWPELELRAAERAHGLFRRAQWVLGALGASLLLASLVLGALGLGAVAPASLLASAVVALGLVTALDQLSIESGGALAALIVGAMSLILLATSFVMLSSLWPALLLPLTLPLLLARRWALGTGLAAWALRGGAAERVGE